MQTQNAKSMNIEVKTITPEIAEAMLKSNTNNRKLSRVHMKELVKDLEEGRYVPTHQGIAFDTEGRLLDGQHRLAAIVESGYPMMLVVATDVDPAAWGVIDKHMRRTPGQVLSMAGLSKDPAKEAQMARTIMTVVQGNTRPTPTEVQEFATAHHECLEAFIPVARRYGPAVAAAFAWAKSIGWDETESAASRLMDKLFLREGDPMRALDRRSLNFKALGSGAGGARDRFNIALNCLLAVHEDRDLTNARSIKPDYEAIAKVKS